ncbi:hypothetical protein SAMN05421743_101405 [Thalassobacillus cyri]|uniref:Uncharacterized protein n=1 Tax=Thalassobacillus cyri TaxID=571932 RepID=A0A1H3WC43_9BACI|nr:hypothetical protein [Thalassobacillus cyri]SDZ84706.1 hypothetical protein SAMN05421743_101405 [Thalassobacillus cyri]
MGIFALIIILFAGCATNETVSVEGKIFEVNHEEDTIIVFVEDSEKQEMVQDKEQKSIEAFIVKPDESMEVKGEVHSFNDLKQGQKVAVEIREKYEEKLVTKNVLFKNHSKLPSYKSQSVTVTPYSKQDIVQELTIEEGYGLYTYNPEPNEEGRYNTYPNSVAADFPFQRVHVTLSVSDVKNTEELLGLYEGSPTYIITDEKGIVFKTNKITELNQFIENLEKPK